MQKQILFAFCRGEEIKDTIYLQKEKPVPLIFRDRSDDISGKELFFHFHQDGIGCDVVAFLYENLLDRTRHVAGDRVFHLHRFEDNHFLSGFYLVADLQSQSWLKFESVVNKL